MTAVSLNVGSSVRLIKPAKLYMCMHKNYYNNKDGRIALGVHGFDSVPLSHLGNAIMRSGL